MRPRRRHWLPVGKVIQFVEPELSEQPFCGREGDPADRPQPRGHGHSHCSQEAYGEKPLLQRGCLDGMLAASPGFA